MPRADNSHHLLAAAQRRASDVRRRAIAAVADIAAAGDPVTPSAVARRAGVSRQWLYTCDEAMAAMREAAGGQNENTARVPPKQAASPASLQRRIEALTDDNKRLRQHAADLERRLAAVYGELRATR